MMFLLVMLNTYLKRFTAAFCMLFGIVDYASIAKAATKFVAFYAWQPLTPLPAPVLRLR